MKWFFPILIAVLSLSMSSRQNAVRTFDDDLSPPGVRLQAQDVDVELAADRTEFEPAAEGLSVSVFRVFRGEVVAVPGLDRVLDCKDGAELAVELPLKTTKFAVKNRGTVYTVNARAKCGALRLYFDAASAGGQAVGIWHVARVAETRLADAVGLDFWKSSITFNFPGDGDYYTYNSVSITRGDYWDVVGHELGHAIYDQGKIGSFGGGQHLIDACYNETLAFSEGWASYFSAWLLIGLDDADAKFEFMVPRRAPIRFENIPGDVCKGSTNEWRVTGFLWDLIDSHEDPEIANYSFAQTWNALTNKRVNGVTAAQEKLRAAGFDEERLRASWELNFR